MGLLGKVVSFVAAFNSGIS